ncbi:MAG: NUDIX hydrolase [Myxococcota bacterium]|nr:NUDIX hydrolase [Myxococcota bacterium]
MPRRPLLELMERYAEHYPGEPGLGAARRLVERHANCFERDCLPGHITASAWISSEDGSRFLLTHHRKLGRWLQLGGHADGENDVLAVARREACEESGMSDFELLPARGGSPLLDIDVHVIPARKGEPEHEHHDMRVLLVARDGQQLAISDESIDLRWFEWSELETVGEQDQSILRLARKAREQLNRIGKNIDGH